MNGSKEPYSLSRGFAANNRYVKHLSAGGDEAKNGLYRQNLQFYLWTHLGYVLHPSIDIKAEGLKVAEIGVATGFVARTHFQTSTGLTNTHKHLASQPVSDAPALGPNRWI